jgi:hypothetical protein
VDFPPVGDLPLWALLSRPLRAFAEQYEAGPGPSLAITANVLRVLTEAGVRTRDIAALGGVSKESVAMAMGVMRKSGIATSPALSRTRTAGVPGCRRRPRYRTTR